MRIILREWRVRIRMSGAVGLEDKRVSCLHIWCNFLFSTCVYGARGSVTKFRVMQYYMGT